MGNFAEKFSYLNTLQMDFSANILTAGWQFQSRVKEVGKVGLTAVKACYENISHLIPDS